MAGTRRYLTINQANLDHGHIYLAECMDLFPSDAVGGANKKSLAARTVQVDYGSGHVNTDVVGNKKILRRRGWVRSFFRENNLHAGDRVVLERLGPYSYRLSAEPLELTCISIQQPWADLILEGKKLVENRNWPWTSAQDDLQAGKKVTLGIHVSNSLTIWQGLADAQRRHFAGNWREGTGTSGGVVAGIVDLTRICRWKELSNELQSHKYTLKEFTYHWVLANPRRLLEPFPWPGNTRTFRVEIPRRLAPAGVD
jgi:hypothetical protein